MKHKLKWTHLVAIVLVLGLALGLVGEVKPTRVEATSTSELENQLDELEKGKAKVDKEIADLQSSIDKNTDAMTQLVQQKSVVDQEIDLLVKKQGLLNSEITAYSLLIADKQEELDKAQVRLVQLQEENKLRIRAMEKNSRISFWSVLFSSSSFMEYLDRMKMIEEIRAEDVRRLQEMKDVAQEVAQAKTVLQEKQAELQASRQEMEQMQVTLEAKRTEADEVLIQLKAETDTFDKLMDESERLQAELMDQIAKKEDEIEDAKYLEWLATSVPSGTGGGNTVGGKTWLNPAPGNWGITSGFGTRWHPIHKEYRHHDGVDIGGAWNSTIVATRAGQVVTSSFQEGGAGHYVVINHGDGFKSIYMHMYSHSEVYVGQYVSAGQKIGEMHTSGGSTGCHLHFGISYNGVWVNPVSYVRF